MVGILHTDAHLFKSEHGLLSQVGGGIPWCQVEITSLVQEFRALRIAEVEKLQFRSYILGVALVRCPLQVLLQDIPWVAIKWLTTRF